MVQGSQEELQDLITVHTFYHFLLEKVLGHGVPVPAEIKKAADSGNLRETISSFKNWIDLLDLAITPPQVRGALKTLPGFTTAHSLLRYFAFKASSRSGERDKTDCIITYLFRDPQGNPPLWSRPEVDSPYLFISQAAMSFEAHLYRVLGDVHYDSLPEEHVNLLGEFELMYQELEEFHHFDQIMDSGIVQRVRELKQSLGKAFYHPDSLSVIAAWNDVFGRKFDILFHDPTKQTKNLADQTQMGESSTMAQGEGDIVVKQPRHIETKQPLAEEYQPQDGLGKASRHPEAVDGKRPLQPSAVALRVREATPAPAVPSPLPAAQVAPNAPQPLAGPAATATAGRTREQARKSVKSEVLAVSPSQAVYNALQEGKIDSAREQIKELVRSADPRMAQIVPVKKTKITLSPAEVEAFRSEYGDEKSFRASYAALLRTIVAYLSRMIVEVDEYNQKATSAHLWKPHALTLAYLLATLDKVNVEGQQLMAFARTRGLADKAAALQASLERVNSYAKTVAQTLQAPTRMPGTNPPWS